MSATYTIGLDIGIASVGWCALGETHIIDLGVRAFDKAETAKEGESLNLARRNARLMRRRLFRRAWRLKKLARLLKSEGLIADSKTFQPEHAFTRPLWQLRVDGLDRRLNDEEWARVIYHLCKHRGFHWISRAEARQAEGDSKSEGGKVKQGLAGTATLMAEKSYRSAAEMVLGEFPDAQRNKQGEYTKALERELLAKELTLLFEKQRGFGNPHASIALETAILGNSDKKSGLFWQQKPALAGADLLKMLGTCTFEKDEYRAPKASFTAERHVWLTRLNNLRIVTDGVTRQLTEQERQRCLPLPYQQASDLTYKQLGTALTKAGLLAAGSFKFIGLAYPTEAQKAEGKVKDPESATLVKIPAWQELHQTLTKAGLGDEWKKLSGDALCGQPEIFDQIAWVLSVYKDNDEVRAELAKLSLPNRNALIDALLNIRFDKFHALSLKALRAIVPHMEKGLRYDEACVEAGYHHSQLFRSTDDKELYLPPFYEQSRGHKRGEEGKMLFSERLDEEITGGIPRNPVVLRALNQARKVVNAIIRKQKSSPVAVHIEMARNLTRPLKGHWNAQGKYIEGRQDIQREQLEYQKRNDDNWQEFKKHAANCGLQEPADRERHGREFAKWSLYREQFGKCAYSLEALDLNRLLEAGYVEIDHALPYSRSFDDSKNNKVLVLTRENRDKGNRTPYEYLGGAENSERWRNFVGFVESNKSYRLAKRTRLLRKDFGEKEAEEFKERNLNDTRYICKFFKNYVERYLKLADGSHDKQCVVLSGQLTSFLRARWGLLKIRSESDRHHALDAAVVAACSRSMVQRLSNYSRTRELEHVRDGFVDIQTGDIVNPAMHQQLREHFPDPWPYFRNELKARLEIDSPEQLREELSVLGSYSEEELSKVKPLFVSRAPQRRNGGAAHQATIYALPKVRHKLKIQDKKTKSIRSATEQELQSLAIERIGVFDTANQGKTYKLNSERLDDIVGCERDTGLLRTLRLWLDKRKDNPKAPGTKDFPRKPQQGDPADGPFSGPIVKKVKLNAGRTSGIEVRKGKSTNESMLRVDIFSKAGKFHLVPIYVHHRVTGLPNRAVVAYKDEQEWTLIDDSFVWCFSLYPNDLVKVRLKNEVFLGYYAGTDRSTGAISIHAHDRNNAVGKDGLIRGIGVKTAVNIEKFHVDTLGNIYPAPPEKRRGLA
jgi:CRISPR-associated endonuclease Csn1